MKKFIIIISINIFLTLNLYSSTLNLSISSSPSRLNPIIASDTASSEITQWLFNGLLKYDKDGNIVADLAKSYEFKTKTNLIFKLKRG